MRRHTWFAGLSALPATVLFLAAWGSAVASASPQAMSPPEVPCAPGGGVKVAPPADGAYLGVYPDGTDAAARVVSASQLGANFDRFHSQTARTPAWGVTLDIWFDGRITFPVEHARTIWERGAVPRIAMLPMSSWSYAGAPDPVFPMQRFIDGNLDDQLTAYARDVKASGIPVILTFGPEVTAGWPWSGAHNGGGETTGYGDPSSPDGPERFRDAYRRVVGLFKAAGADNVTWVFHVSPPTKYDEEWNQARSYYPGDDVVDWIGTSIYGEYPGVPFQTFKRQMDAVYPVMTQLSPTKPLAIVELGMIEDPQHSKATWVRNAVRELRRGRWPRVRAVTWWDEHLKDDAGKEVGTAIDTSRESLKASRKAFADRYFVDRVRFTCASGGA